MINGIGALDFRTLGTSLGSADSAFQGNVGSAGGAQTVQSFASMLADAATDVAGTLQSAEAVSMKALQGDADTREVVDAVMSAEQAMQAAVAIRDKIVSAYMEISRMAI